MIVSSRSMLLWVTCPRPSRYTALTLAPHDRPSRAQIENADETPSAASVRRLSAQGQVRTHMAEDVPHRTICVISTTDFRISTLATHDRWQDFMHAWVAHELSQWKFVLASSEVTLFLQPMCGTNERETMKLSMESLGRLLTFCG